MYGVTPGPGLGGVLAPELSELKGGITMACTCTAAAPAGVPFTVDGTLYYVASGTYSVAALLAAISSGPNFLSGAINGFRNTVNNTTIQGPSATQTINGGEALVSLYGPF
jgi:hypothetical protein